MKKMFLLLGMFAISFLGFAQVSRQQAINSILNSVVNREFSPVSSLTVEIGINDKVDLVWNMPENNLHRTTISWITSETNGGGSTQAGTDNIFGHLYNHFDLRNHVGWDIDTISFYKTTPWTYSIYIWKQPVGESMQIVHSQLAQISDSIQNAWCSVALDTTITIEENTDYWFGIRATCEEGQATGLCPIPFDDGPAVTGKGDLFMPDLAHWMAMQIGYNAMIKTTLSNASQTGKTSKEQNSCSGYRVYRDGQLIKEIPYSFVTYFTDTEFTKETDVEYCVTAVYGEEESEPVCATATITGITEKPENDGITVSPNPTNGLVRIEGVEVAEVLVYNALGQLVKFAQNSNEINLRGLPQGVYSLRIIGNKGEITSRKIVVE